jgi:hypothetical protein
MNKHTVVEDLLQTMMFSNISNNKILEKKQSIKVTKLTYQAHAIKNDLRDSYGLHIDEYCMIYFVGLGNYLLDKKDALVVSAWIAYSIKKLHLYNPVFLQSNKIDIHLLKQIPLPSKEMLISLWSASIETYCFDKIEYKHSLHFLEYFSN